MKTLLLIDDQESGLATRKMLLESRGYKVLTAQSGREGLEALSREAVDLLILDYRMPEMDGGEVARLVKQRFPEMPMILLSGVVGDFPPEVLAHVDRHIVKGQPVSDLFLMVEELTGEKARRERPAVDAREVLRLSVDHAERSRKLAKQNIDDIDNTRARLTNRRGERTRRPADLPRKQGA